MGIEVVNALTLCEPGDPVIETGNAIVGDEGGAGGENRLENDLCLGLTLAETLDEGIEVLKDFAIADPAFEIVDPSHDVDRVWTGLIQVG